MKRISLILAAAALVLGLSQCKKQEQEPQASTGGTVAITLDVNSPAGSRIDVNTASGEVKFEQGDVVHVGFGGQYVGTLTHDGSIFKGDLRIGSNVSAGDNHFHFYFLGNKDAGTLTPGQSTSCSVDISDQTGKLPVISYAESVEEYRGEGRYTAFFKNKAALVEFNLNARMRSSHTLWLTELGNKVTVDFTQPAGNNNGFSFETEPIYGPVKTNYVDNNRTKVYAIVPPASSVTGSAYVMRGTQQVQGTSEYSFTIDVLWANEFKSVEVPGVTIPSSSYTAPEGAVSGHVFTVSDGLNAKEVFFSQGNLQYIGSAGNGDDDNTGGYWKFADQQWLLLGYSQKGEGKLIDRDLFSWGTSGHKNPSDNLCEHYMPWSTSDIGYPGDTVENYWHYGPTKGIGDGSLTGENAIYDWGHNVIVNGGNQGGLWRTLTTDEWQYLFKHRTTPSVDWHDGTSTPNVRYAKAKLMEVGANKPGVILFPDEYEHPEGVEKPVRINNHLTGYNENQYSLEDFGKMAAKGAVFLPAPGVRGGTDVGDVYVRGGYWSASPSPLGSAQACLIYFHDSGLTSGGEDMNRYNGLGVRLVQDVN